MWPFNLRVITDEEVADLKEGINIFSADIISESEEGNRYASRLIGAIKSFVYNQGSQRARRKLAKAYNRWLES